MVYILCGLFTRCGGGKLAQEGSAFAQQRNLMKLFTFGRCLEPKVVRD
jgi:hypothetical protein